MELSIFQREVNRETVKNLIFSAWNDVIATCKKMYWEAQQRNHKNTPDFEQQN